MALNSVHTNTSALIALQSLNVTNRQLDATQNRVSTGFRINGAKDDAAGFSIAQGLRGDIKGYEAISEQLSKAKGTMSVAGDAATQISNTLAELRKVVTKLADENVSGSQRTQYGNDYTALIADIQRYTDNATFNGVNLLTTTAGVNVIGNLDGTSILLRGHDVATDVIGQLTAITSAADAQAMLTGTGGLVTAEANMGDILSIIGADSRMLDNQISYLGILSDATEEGIGAIVDADLAKESAKLQALQVRQQLGTQALSIANQAPNILLSLFGQ